MKIALKLILPVFLFLSACALEDGKGQKVQEGKIADDLRKARQDIAPIIGVWTGTLNRGGTLIDIELNIQEKLKVVGQTSSGQAIYNVDPSASLSSLDGRYNQSFSGTFLKSTGELILTTEQNSSDDLDLIRSLTLKYANERLVGGASSSSQPLGEVILARKNRQSDGSGRNNQELKAERLRRIYAPLVGTWVGTTNQRHGSKVGFPFQITIRINEVADESNGTLPVLRATYDRPDMSPGVGRRNMNVTYAYSDTPPTLTMTSNNPNGYQVSVAGQFSRGPDGNWDLARIVGTHTNLTTGAEGEMELRKAKD